MRHLLAPVHAGAEQHHGDAYRDVHSLAESHTTAAL